MTTTFGLSRSIWFALFVFNIFALT